MDSKKCTKCQEEKPVDQFNCKNKKTGVRESRCKVCFAEYTRNHYQNNKAYYAEKANYNRQQHLLKTRELLRLSKSIPCADCKQTYPSYVMDFDHLGDKVENVSKMVSNKLELIEMEIAKCEVVCSNCHRIRTHLRGQSRPKGRSHKKPPSLKMSP